ncbi:MAG: hypothetical protein FJ276_26875 [Planctomycetes bacterium]|nr:hypothetical protein [Planctomycetota bacterium]
MCDLMSTSGNGERTRAQRFGVGAAAVEQTEQESRRDGKVPAMITCRNCSNTNSMEHRFCRNCGKSLWNACLRCGEERPVDEKFCSRCGVDRLQLELQMIAQHKSRLADTEELVKRGQSHDALLAFKRLAAEQTHPCLANVRAATEKWIARLSAEVDRLSEKADTVRARAQGLFDRRRYHAAADELRQYPRELRDNAMNGLLAAAEQAAGEVDELRRRICQNNGMECRDRMQLVNRLLTLQPEDEQVRKWSAQLRRQLRATVEAKLAGQDYDAVVDMLETISDQEMSDEDAALLRNATELAHLASELDLAPRVTPAAVEAAKRLAQLDPANRRAAEAHREMLRRLAEAKARTPDELPEWTACPEETLLRAPIRPCGMPRRVSFQNAECRREFAMLPGRFSVALGLALQTLGRAAIDMNLLPTGNRGVLDKLRASLRDRPARAGWGLDLSKSGLKAVKAVVAEDDEVRVARCVFLPSPQAATPLDVDPAWRVTAQEILKKFMAEANIEPSDRAAVQWPGLRSLVRFLSIPPAREKRARELIHYEVRHQIPFPIDEVCWRTHQFAVDSESLWAHREVLLVAIKLKELQERLAVFADAGVDVHVVQCDAIALHNLIRYQRSQDGAGATRTGIPESTAVLDIGSDATNMVFSSQNSVWFRSTSLGGDDLSKALVRRFKLTREAAELVKRHPERARRMSDLHKECCAVYEKLVQQYEKSCGNYEKTTSGRAVGEVLLTGGASQSPGLLRYLRHGR